MELAVLSEAPASEEAASVHEAPLVVERLQKEEEKKEEEKEEAAMKGKMLKKLSDSHLWSHISLLLDRISCLTSSTRLDYTRVPSVT